MNERIKELAEQATITKTELRNGWERKTYTYQEEVFDKEKFAELIVRECADIASINQHQYCSVGKYVLEHFGVES